MPPVSSAIRRQAGTGVDEVEGRVLRQPNEHDVAYGAQPRALTEGDPREQHQCADRDGDPADLDAEVPGDPLVQNVPRTETEAGPDH
jgi:hypothetical protein